MKKTLLFITALLFCSFAFAQQGEIIYTDFDPDLTLVQGINSNDSIMLDIDYDDVYDLKFGLVYYHFEFPVYTALNGWSICQVNDSTDLTTDTLFWLSYIDYGFTNYFGLKKVVGENCYYGWLYTYDGQTKNNKGTKAGTLFIDRMAYCTIPNYPLRAGQTSLTDDIVENGPSQHHGTRPESRCGVQHVRATSGHGHGRRRDAAHRHRQPASRRLLRQRHPQGRAEMRAQGGEGIEGFLRNHRPFPSGQRRRIDGHHSRMS